MKVIYRGTSTRRTNSLPEGTEDVIELFSNNWNDYGYETLFMTVCRIHGSPLELGAIRLLIDGQTNSRKFLNELLNKGWNGEFPIPDTYYISTPSEIAFYEQLDGALAEGGAILIASLLKDASYLVHLEEDAIAQEMVQKKGFKDSLQRERGSIEAYMDGWRILDRSSIASGDIKFSFKDVFGKISKIAFQFSNPKNILPHDINVIIGANGAGKSQILRQMVDAWISDDKTNRERGFSPTPNLSRLIVISYSPFELFPVDMSETKLQDKSAYKYCGLRGRATLGSPSSALPIRLSREVPQIDAANSLQACIADDQRYHIIKNWGQKIRTAERALRNAIEFDCMALEIEADVPIQAIYNQVSPEERLIELTIAGIEKRYLPIDADILNLNLAKISRCTKASSGVVFLKDDKVVKLSSGQRLFTYVVINILGAIKRNSLILIDEPELFLHPSLEIQLVEMLKGILHSFNSKALLATHSLVTVREVPASCVHVMQKTDDGLVIRQPPFQTFGGDVQRISSYVFGDRSVSKPFESWIRTQLDKHYDTADDLIEALGDDINDEMLIQIKAMERGQW